MRTSIKDASAAPTKTDLLVVFGLQGKKPELPTGVKLPAAALRQFEGGFRKTRLADATSGPAGRVLLVGLGKAREANAERLRRAAALAAKQAEGLDVASATLWISPAVEKAAGGAEAVGRAATEGALMAGYSYQECKSKQGRKAPTLKSLTLAGGGAAFRKGARRGKALAEANAFARDLQNAPANVLRPRDVAAKARKLAQRSPRITCKVLDEKAMAREKMGLLLGVSRGSSEPAYLVHLTYKPKGRSRGKIAFIGKGLTFDAGGISLKPPAKMDEMKYDMSGSAAVLGVFHALGDLDVPYEVHGIVGTTENMPGGKATKPGDVHTGRNGTTVEVLNTDAEGRLVLADCLSYTADKVKPDTMVDLATLTGAVVVALGHELSGVFTTSKNLESDLVAAGESSGELVWPLPLLELHREQMKGTVADLKNINTPGSGNGASAGAAFLSHFTGDVEWAHLDIAGTAWGQKDRDYVGGGLGTGVGVRLLIQYLEDRKG